MFSDTVIPQIYSLLFFFYSCMRSRLCPFNHSFLSHHAEAVIGFHISVSKCDIVSDSTCSLLSVFEKTHFFSSVVYEVMKCAVYSPVRSSTEKSVPVN